MTAAPTLNRGPPARYVSGTEFAHGIGGGGRPARPRGRLPVEEERVSEVCDVLTLVTIAHGLRKPVAAFVAGAAQHR